MIPPVPSTVPAGMTTAAGALPKTGIEDPLLLLQYQQMQLLQNHLLLRQMRTSAIAKLSQLEQWATLSPMEQNQLILQCVVQDSEVPEVPLTTNPFAPHITSQAATNPVMQLFTQMQQVTVRYSSPCALSTHLHLIRRLTHGIAGEDATRNSFTDESTHNSTGSSSNRSYTTIDPTNGWYTESIYRSTTEHRSNFCVNAGR